MSASRGNGAGVQAIPTGARKVVLSLKEIVDCSETEIYAALKECSMDPNEAVNRLLSQDPFHEVKSKREKKKEGRDATESSPRASNKTSSRGNRIGTDQYGGKGGSSSYNSSDSTPLPGKSLYTKEHGSIPHSGSSSSVLVMSANIRSSRGSAGLSNCVPAEIKTPSLSPADAAPSGGIQPTSGYQSAWTGASGQLSMADIVKRGRLHNKVSNAPNALAHNIWVPLKSVSDHNLVFSEDHVAKVPESGISTVQHVQTNEEWSTFENPTASKAVSVSEYAMHSEQHLETSGVLSDSFNEHSEEEVQDIEDVRFEHSGTTDVGSDTTSGRKFLNGDSGGVFVLENDLYKNMGSYQHQILEDHSGVADEECSASVSTVARNLQQLTIEEEYSELPSSECVPAVVIPEHLQVQNVDCSHLSFGSFRLGMTAGYSSGTTTSIPVKPDLEQPHAETVTSSVGHHETRSSEYFVDNLHKNASDGGLLHRASASSGSYDTTASKSEDLRPEIAEVPHGNEYHFPSSNPGYAFDDAQGLNPAFVQTNFQMQNLTPFSDVMQSNANSVPGNSTLLPANLPLNGECSLRYSPFPDTQSTSAKYGNSVSSIGGSVISMSEALKTAGSSLAESAPPSLSVTNVATGPPLPQQHLSLHPYSQHTLPLGPFASMIGYPLLPQSYAYVPSAFQQTFASNNSYYQSLAALLPQYKSSVSASSLPPSAAVPSGYSAFGNTTIPGNFPMNPPTAPSGTCPLNYDDILNSQNKDISHLIALQQGENPAMWLHGPNSRTVPAIPAGAYYQARNQQNGALRQGQQQPLKNYVALGYPNPYHHSQTGMSPDDLQNTRDGLLLGATNGQPKPSQIWQNGF